MRARNRKKGQSMIAMGLILAFGVILVIGLFAFEINRVEVARQQLRSACEAAALAAAATLASQDSTDPTTAQMDSLNTALTTFHQNSVLGTSLSPAYLAWTANDKPAVNASSIYVQFLDPHNNNRAVSIGDPAGKIVQVTAAFGLKPAFGAFLKIPNVQLNAIAQGGVPNLDVVLCFDVSASIDDQTPVSFVKRVWNSNTNKINYTIASTSSGSPAGSLAQGTIFDILGPPATGSTVNGIYPQHLGDANSSSTNDYPMYFSETSGTGSAVGLRGAANSGSPPGNYSNKNLSTGNTHTYTDLVVNIDGKTPFAGITSNGYSFPDVATLVEAARGNLENSTVFQNSKANVSVSGSISPRSGYQAEYFRLAAANLHPLADAQTAAQEFLTIMNTNTDAHFSVITFSTEAGSSSSDTYSDYNVDNDYSKAGSGNFPNPLIALNPATTTTNYSSCYDMLPTTVPLASTNIGSAVNNAVTQLTKNCRTGSKKAIVVFTDGQPTTGTPLDADPWTNTRKAAVNAKNAGIPIYTIGLAQNPQIITGETQILNDSNSNSSTGGIAAIAGNGGKFFLVTKTSDLRATFENIARQLVQLVH